MAEDVADVGGEAELDALGEGGELERAALERIKRSYREATARDYRKKFDEFAEWRRRRGGRSSMPAGHWEVVAFVEWKAQHSTPGVALKTLFAISRVHEWMGFEPPRSAMLGRMAKALEKEAKRAKRLDARVSPLPVEAIMALAREKGGTSRQRRRREQFVVGLTLGTRAVKRAADLSKVRLRHVQVLEDGEKLCVFFPDTKNHAEGESVLMDVGKSALMRRLLGFVRESRKTGTPEQLLFRNQRGNMTSAGFWSDGVAMAIRALAKERGRGVEGNWSSRAMRVGGTSRMQRLGMGEADIVALSGHQSERALRFYMRQEHLANQKLSEKMMGGSVVS